MHLSENNLTSVICDKDQTAVASSNLLYLESCILLQYLYRILAIFDLQEQPLRMFFSSKTLKNTFEKIHVQQCYRPPACNLTENLTLLQAFFKVFDHTCRTVVEEHLLLAIFSFEDKLGAFSQWLNFMIKQEQ